MRLQIQELEYVLALPFAKFWAHMTLKNGQLVKFLDTFLLNLRKCNDTYKLQVLAHKGHKPRQEESFGMIEMIGTESSVQSRNSEVVEHVQILLQAVFALFCRISLASESEEEMLPQRTDLVYQNYLIDIAKLYDIAAIYGPLSPD